MVEPYSKTWFNLDIFTARSLAERGIAKASSPSVRLSVCRSVL